MESFSFIKVLGVFLSVVGALSLNDFSKMSLSDSKTNGLILLMICQILYSIYNILQKYLMNREEPIPPMTVCAWTYIMADGCSAVLGCLFWYVSDDEVRKVVKPDFSLGYFSLYMLYIVVVHSTIAVFITAYLNKYLQPSIFAASNTIQVCLLIVMGFDLPHSAMLANLRLLHFLLLLRTVS
eukprot:TRINITY_DN3427_c0_g1_i1.p1 TRINITY_DN3427_c0_g1~~TRINITY_DN3427_c0_g1_i1.p1  ORF type:complete len:182 (+),score=34.99 TRINITY_DN3427_c0_g1_i1:471-1016(+)